MLSQQGRQRVERATIRIASGNRSGHATLVNGALFIGCFHVVREAAHWKAPPAWQNRPVSLGHEVTATPRHGKPFPLQVAEFNPELDFAVLVAPPNGGHAANAFIRQTAAVPIADQLEPGEVAPCSFLQFGRWIAGNVTRKAHRYELEAREPLQPGVSGSALVDEAGKLLGCIISADKTGRRGPIIPAVTALPTWAIELGEGLALWDQIGRRHGEAGMG